LNQLPQTLTHTRDHDNKLPAGIRSGKHFSLFPVRKRGPIFGAIENAGGVAYYNHATRQCLHEKPRLIADLFAFCLDSFFRLSKKKTLMDNRQW